MENLETNENFEQLFKESLKEEVKLEKVVTGTVLRITKNKEIFVDLGYKADGIIPRDEYSFNEEDDPNNEFKVGDIITADVVKLNDGLGNVLLSYKRARTRNARKEFEQKVNEKEILTTKITEANEKGFITDYKGIRIFIPLSLSGITRNENIQDYKNKTVEYVIVEYNPENRKVIGSIKELKDKYKKEKQEKFWAEAQVDKKYEGTVASISDYGAFVEVCEGIQGLLHVSEMSWKRNINPHDILEVNQKVNVAIKELDLENKRLKLTLEEKGPNPWEQAETKYKVNDIVKVEIVKFMPFGAFAEIEPGVEGLIHISQISEERILKPEDKLQLGQELNAKIINIDLENKKIELSVREIEGTSYE